MTISHFVKKQAVRTLVPLLKDSSDANLVRLLTIADKLASREQDRRTIDSVRAAVQTSHPFIQLMRRILREHHPNCVTRLISNLVVEGLLVNNDEREKGVNLLNRAGLFALLISPTMRCNLRCTGCYALNYSREDDLDMALVDRIIREGRDLNVAFYTILGGEPFVKTELFDLFKKYNDCYFQVYTNGTLITDKMCQKLVEVGNVSPQISVEGYQELTDARRGEGVYASVMKAMDRLKAHGVLFGFSTCVTSQNVEIVFSEEFIDFMIDKGAVFGFYFLFMPVCGSPDLSLMPTPQQRVFMYERGRYIRANKPLFIVDFWHDAPYVGGCIAGKRYAHINANGDVEPCIFTHFAVDNIKEKPLAECLESDYFKALRQRQPYNCNLLMPCQWIDNPTVSRELYEQFNLRPTHAGADDILKDAALRATLDQYAIEVEKALGEVWHNVEAAATARRRNGRVIQNEELKLDHLLQEQSPNGRGQA